MVLAIAPTNYLLLPLLLLTFALPLILFSVKVRSIRRPVPTTVGQNEQLLWEQKNFDVTVGQRLVPDENSAS